MFTSVTTTGAEEPSEDDNTTESINNYFQLNFEKSKLFIENYKV